MNILFHILASIFITVPLVFSIHTTELFEFPKMLVIYGYSAVLTPIALFLYFNKNAKKQKTSKQHSDWIHYFAAGSVLLFLFSQTLSTIWSIDKFMSFFGYYSRFNGGLLSILAYTGLAFSEYVFIQTKKDFFTLIKYIFAGGILTALWTLPSKFGYDFICLISKSSFSTQCWSSSFNPVERVFGTIGQPNWFAAYFIILTTIILFMIITRQKILNRLSIQKNIYILTSSFIFFTLLIVWSRSRSGMIAYIVATIIMLGSGFYSKTFRKNFNNYRIILYFITAVSLIAAFMSFKSYIQPVFRKNLISKKIPQTQNMNRKPLGQETGITPSSKIRLIVWKGALKLFQKHPIIGTGAETFALSYYFTRPQEHNMTSEWDYVYNKAHNEFLNILANTGIIGLVSYLVLISAAAAIGLEYMKSKTLNSNFGILLISITASLLIVYFFGFSITTTSIFFFIIPSSLLGLLKAKRISNPASLPKYFFIIYISFILIVFNYLINYYNADIHLAKARNYIANDNISAAYTQLRQALIKRTDPEYMNEQAYLSAQLALYYKSVNNTEKQKEFQKQAVSLNKKTLKISPNNVFYWKTQGKIFYLLSLLHLDNKKLSEKFIRKSARAFNKTNKLAPTDPKNYVSLALIIADYNPKKALNILNKAIELKPNYKAALQYKKILFKKQ